MTYVRKVERLNTRGPVNILRVVDDKILFEGKSYFVTLFICTEAGNRGVAVGVAIAETKSFRRRYLHAARIGRKVIREIHRERVVAVCAGAILRIQKVEAVNDCIGTMSVTRTLKGVEIVAPLLDERKNIFIFAVLVVDTFAPFAHKLVVEHVQNVLGRHHRTDCTGYLCEFFRAAANEFPEYRIMPGETVRALALVHGIEINHVIKFQVRIVSFAEKRIHIVGQNVPYKAIPRYEHHVFCAVIHRHEIVRQRVPCERGFIGEILFILAEEFRRIALTTLNPRP